MKKNADQNLIIQAMLVLGIDARPAEAGGPVRYGDVDIAHVFNSWRPNESLPTVKELFGNGMPIVFSPQYLNLGELQFVAPRMMRTFRQKQVADLDIEQRLADIAHESRKLWSQRAFDAIEYFPGYFDQIQQMVEMADEVICQSNLEKSLLWRICAGVSRANIVRPGIDTKPYAGANATLFEERTGIKDYVLCVGSLEMRNNQLLLARALRDVNIPVVFIGEAGDQAYSEMVRAHAGPLMQFIAYPDAESDLLASALAGCRLFVLPSFCESAPLAALQAGAAGAPLLLSDRSAEREYFGDLANYCDPADFHTLKATVLALYDSPQPTARRRDLQEYVRCEFNIDKSATEAVKVYQRALSKRQTRRTLFGIPENAPICIDVTSLAHTSEPLTDQSRTAWLFAKDLAEHHPDRVRICQWDSEFRLIDKQSFLCGEFAIRAGETISPADGDLGNVEPLCSGTRVAGANWRSNPTPVLPTESILFILGNGWMQNEQYASSVHNEVKRNRLRLAAIVSDDLPIASPQFETKTNLRAFRFGFSNLLKDANLLLTFSGFMSERLRASCLSRGLAPPPIKTLDVGCGAVDIWNLLQQSLLGPILPPNEVSNAAATQNEAGASLSGQTGVRSAMLIGPVRQVVIQLPDDTAVALDFGAEPKFLRDFPNTAQALNADAKLGGRGIAVNRNVAPPVDVEKVKQEILREYWRRKSTKRILLECTHTISTDVTTGIQRVVRNVIREAEQLQNDLSFEFVPVIIKNGEFYDARKQHDGTALASVRGKIYFSDRDILLLLDASWHLPAWFAVREARARGCRVGAVYYDLIPVQFPQFCDDNLVQLYREWLDQAVQHVDFFIAISKYTSRGLEDYARSSGLRPNARPDQFTSFRLGADFANDSPTGEPRQELRQLFAEDRSNSPYLCVGTIEPRKNHKYVLDAFDLTWQQDQRAKLCLVGRVGWKCAEFIARVRQHALYGKSLFMFNDLSDAELRFCYERAKMLIFPSIIEGFGLPIIEALHFGLLPVASDIPIHREVGEDYCGYFDLENAQSLTRIIRHVEQQGKYPAIKSAEGYCFTSWKESCRELLAKCLELSNRTPRAGSVQASFTV